MLLKSNILGQKGTYTYFSFCVSNLKMWTVSVLLEADRYKPSILNASEQMLTHLRKHTESSQSNPVEQLNFMKNQNLYHLNHQIYLLTPLRNSKSFCPSGIEKTRMTVPWGGSERCTEDDKTRRGKERHWFEFAQLDNKNHAQTTHRGRRTVQ